MIDDGCWKQVWAEMTDAELEDRLFTYLWLAHNSINPHDDRVAQLIQEAERRGKTRKGGKGSGKGRDDAGCESRVTPDAGNPGRASRIMGVGVFPRACISAI